MLDTIDLERLKDTARQAGDAIMSVYGTEFSVDVKEDKSPLTEADRQSNEVIIAALEKHFAGIPVISEETREVPYDLRKDWDTYWLVDPLDGTKEFIKRNGEFTVNIALVKNRVPVAGFVFQPGVDRLYWACEGRGAFRSLGAGADEPIHGGDHYRDVDEVTVVASRSHLGEAVKEFVASLEAEGKKVEFLSSGSSLKLCMVAEGAAHVYPRLGPTMEWDTAAAHAVAREAGKQVLAYETRQPLDYNKENLLNPWFIVE